MSRRQGHGSTRPHHDPDLVRALEALRDEVVAPPTPATAERHLRAITTAALVYGEAGLPRPVRRLPRLVMRATALSGAKLVIGASMAVATTAGLAGTGSLPAPIQRVVVSAAEYLGLGAKTGTPTVGALADIDRVTITDLPAGEAPTTTGEAATPNESPSDAIVSGAEPRGTVAPGGGSATGPGHPDDVVPGTRSPSTLTKADAAASMSTTLDGSGSGNDAGTSSGSSSGTTSGSSADGTASTAPDGGDGSASTEEPSGSSSEAGGDGGTAAGGDDAGSPGRSGERRRDDAAADRGPSGSGDEPTKPAREDEGGSEVSPTAAPADSGSSSPSSGAGGSQSSQAGTSSGAGGQQAGSPHGSSGTGSAGSPASDAPRGSSQVR